MFGYVRVFRGGWGVRLATGAVDFAALAASRRLASINRKLPVFRYGVFTNTVKFYTFRQLGRRLVRIIHPDRSEFASA